MKAEAEKCLAQGEKFEDEKAEFEYAIYAKEEVVSKMQSFERLKAEAEKCLAQSEKFKYEKAEFESAVHAKFVGALNSKKVKFRELRDQFSKLKTSGKLLQKEEVH
ncbi:DNA repair protein XRCC4-like [Magnolia sinica]|uniref:DNA repair protein XRCC4-like n=1 Tax=Magnolia sinica TaxID=86752 RepID=UPI0026592B92|nr:DNA repair protein XRCC4-like [Magnolia sinica]